MMKLTESQASTVFDILVQHGNFDARKENWVAHKKAEFIEDAANGLNEYWYPSACGSSIKVYFSTFSEKPIWVYAQTLNTTKERNLVADTNAALQEFVTTERSK